MKDGGLLVLVLIGGQRFAWWAAGAVDGAEDGARTGGVEGVAAMAAVTPLPGAGQGVAGMLNVHGDTRLVVDPRAALGLPPVTAHPDQHLLLVLGQTRFLVWVDRAEGIVSAHPAMFDALPVDGAPVVARLDGAVVPILEARTFDPSRLPDGQRADKVADGEP